MTAESSAVKHRAEVLTTSEPAISLRPLSVSDGLDLLEAIGDYSEYLRTNMNWASDVTSDNVEDKLTRAEIAAKDGTFLPYMVIHNVDQKIIGEVSLHSRNFQASEAQISYWISPEYQSNGYATAATKAIIAHGFTTWNLDKIVFQINPNNASSAAVAKKLGAVFVNVANTKSEHWEVTR